MFSPRLSENPATKKLSYHILDVFTDRAFGGNPLAVFLEAEGLSDATMQSIAKELNLSETTFVLPPQDNANDFKLRIFTPVAELPMAGHPTIGTAFVLAREGLVRRDDSETMITFEEGVGPIPVLIMWKEDAPDFVEMQQPRPEFGARLPVEVVSCGLPYLFVPLDGLDAMRRIRFRLDVWDRVLRGSPAQDVFVFTKEVQFPGSNMHSRMFAPAYGIAEDAATGSANGPLGCYLVRHGALPSDGELRCVSEQGIEMGRPSFLHISVTHTNRKISAIKVGGRCHCMGAGYLEIEETL
jgi:trans-2,3-dihydro-3-hydroxyanthranilate isomerase